MMIRIQKLQRHPTASDTVIVYLRGVPRGDQGIEVRDQLLRDALEQAGKLVD